MHKMPLIIENSLHTESSKITAKRTSFASACGVFAKPGLLGNYYQRTTEIINPTKSRLCKGSSGK